MIVTGVIRGTVAATRSQTACALRTAICWPVMARASVTNGSPRLIRKPSGCFGITRRRMRSRLMRSARASSQYSGQPACRTGPDDAAAGAGDEDGETATATGAGCGADIA